jgi:hypothetical protein
MTAILILVGIVVVVIGTIVLVTVPVKRAEAVARDFPWRRSVHIGTRTWVKKSRSGSRSHPSTSGTCRPKTPTSLPSSITPTRSVCGGTCASSQPRAGARTVRDPQYTLARDEAVRRKTEVYKANFVSEEGRRYSAKVRLAQWRSLEKGTKYQLGRNTFGRARTIKPAKPVVNQRPPSR